MENILNPIKILNLHDYSEEYVRRVRETFALDPDVLLTITGPSGVKEWHLYFNNASVKGLLLDSMVNLLERNPMKEELADPEFLTKFIYWALKAKHPDITKEVVDSEVLVLKYLPYILSQVTEAVTVFRPDLSGIELEKAESITDPPKPPTVAG